MKPQPTIQNREEAYKEQQLSLSQYQPSQAETMQRAANMRNIHIQQTWETGRVHAKPSKTIHPAIIIAAIDGALIGLWTYIHPEVQLLCGVLLTLAPLTCMVYVAITNFSHIKKEIL